MPVLHEEQEVGGQPAFWFRLLQPYVKDSHIYQCPDDDTGTFANYGGRASYGFNVHIGGAALPGQLPPGIEATNKTESQILRPAATVMMTDSGSIAMGTLPGFSTENPPEQWSTMTPCPAEIGDAAVVNPTSPPSGNSVPVGAFPAPRARHAAKTNVLWADGHVTSAKIESFYVPPGVTAPGETRPGYSPCLRPEKGCP
jgi:prepilin-type processing-associated H-X9-DG protein